MDDILTYLVIFFISIFHLVFINFLNCFLQLKVRETDDLRANSQVNADLNTLISVLESPVFQSILSIQDSLKELKRQVIKHLVLTCHFCSNRDDYRLIENIDKLCIQGLRTEPNLVGVTGCNH